jgi:enoyl-CoA hydratase
MTNQRLRVDRVGQRAEVVLSNPGQLNAMNRGFFHAIRDSFRQLSADPEVRVVLLWAEGRVFSAGLDLSDTAGLLPPDAADGSSEVRRRQRLGEVIRDFQDCFTQVQRCRQPVIAAVQGWCLGGGLDLATACDIRLGSADAQFAVHETRMAMVADLGTLQRITALVGKGLAREMAFTGGPIDARRAFDHGLINAIYPDPDQLLAAARDLADRIAANSPLAVQGVKRVLDYSDAHGEGDGLEFVAQWNTAFFESLDLNEALRAFTEKREPRFGGD